MRMRREKRWESTLRTAKQGIGVGCAHDHYYASPAPLEMKGVGTGRGAPSSFPQIKRAFRPAWHILYSAVALRVASVGDHADTKKRPPCDRWTPV